MKEEFPLYFDEGLLNRLQEYAEQHNMTLEEVLQLAVREFSWRYKV